MTSFGQRLKTLRREADLSQAELAEELGVSVHSVSKWECDSNMPDVSLLVPLSVILGVTTDSLLGAGTNEKEDRDALIKQIHEIESEPWREGHESKAYRIFTLIEKYLKKYPLDREMKTQCAVWIHNYLYVGRIHGRYDITDDEFEELKGKGFRMAEAVCIHDNDPKHISKAMDTLAQYYCLEEKWDKAEETAMKLPNNNCPRLNALLNVYHEKGDYKRAEEIESDIAMHNYFYSVLSMRELARRISTSGQKRKEEAIVAWQNALKCVQEFDRLFGKYWPGKLEEVIWNCPSSKILVHEILFYLSGDLLALERVDEALDCVEQVTEISLELYDECREKLLNNVISEKEYHDTVNWLKNSPNACYSYVIAEDDNILSREERFKACKARLDALE